MAQWLWWLQSDTLGSSPTVAIFFSSPFSPSRLSSNETSIIQVYHMSGNFMTCTYKCKFANLS